MAREYNNGVHSVYLKCAFPSSVKLNKGQSWTVVKKVPANSPLAVTWFAAMSKILARKQEEKNNTPTTHNLS